MTRVVLPRGNEAWQRPSSFKQWRPGGDTMSLMRLLGQTFAAALCFVYAAAAQTHPTTRSSPRLTVDYVVRYLRDPKPVGVMDMSLAFTRMPYTSVSLRYLKYKGSFVPKPDD